MPAYQAEFPINELAKKANVSVRTIRFYINEGLLPPPQPRGRYAVYTDEYLDRLDLIRRLKDSFLPLKEIRSTLISLSWDEVRKTLDDLRKREAEQDRAAESKEGIVSNRHPSISNSSALDYINNLLFSSPVNRPLPPKPPAPSAKASRMFLLPAQPESWQRISLTNGVELHVRQPVQPEDQSKVEEIIKLSRKLFPS